MTPLTPLTQTLIEILLPGQTEAASRLLKDQCGQNLPFCEKGTPESLQRLHFAALKISAGKMEKLQEAVLLAKKDWRDLLMWAEFANDLNAHQKWADQILTQHP